MEGVLTPTVEWIMDLKESMDKMCGTKEIMMNIDLTEEGDVFQATNL